MIRGWDIAVLGVLAGLAVSAFVLDGLNGPVTAVMLTVIVAIGLLYVFRVRRFTHSDFGAQQEAAGPLQGSITVVILIALVGTLVWFEPSMMFAQILVFPFAWMCSQGARQAIALTLLAWLVLSLGFAGGRGWTPTALLFGFGVESICVLFAIAMGLWIDRIARWGEERAELLAELEEAQGALDSAHRDAGARIERERIARELHDTVAQGLSSIVMLAQRAGMEAEPGSTIALIEDTASESLAEARALVTANASLSGFKDSSLNAGIVRLGDRFTRETGIEVTVEATAGRHEREIEVVLVRCVQEALSNIRKHSGATSARVAVSSDGNAVELAVSDNGRGLGGYTLESDAGFGLSGMHDRLTELGGTLSIAEVEPSGTRLTVRILTPGAGQSEGSAVVEGTA